MLTNTLVERVQLTETALVTSSMGLTLDSVLQGQYSSVLVEISTHLWMLLNG